MPDPYAAMASADLQLQERLAAVLELRATDAAQRAMLRSYTAELELGPAARVLEVGCGTGAISRQLVNVPGVARVVGVDPCLLFIERARELTHDPRVEFAVGDGCRLELDDEDFDAVVFHTVLSHVPERERALAEAHRVLRPAGLLAIFDGDYATTTVATCRDDPLQACVDAAVAGLVHDPWLMRRIVPLVRQAGFDDCRLRGHAYTRSGDADYLLTLVERGADLLTANAALASTTGDALKAEAHARVAAGTFFGHIAYSSLIARRA